MEKKDQPNLVLKEQRDLSNKKLTYVSADVHTRLKSISQKTNIPMTVLIDKMLNYAFEYLEIEELKSSEE